MLNQIWVGCYDLLSAKGDRFLFIQECKDNGATGIRIFGQYTWGKNICVPFNQVTDKARIDAFTYPEGIRKCLKRKDGAWWFNRPENPTIWKPLYDLEDFDNGYFTTLSWLGSISKHFDLALHIDLDDYCSLKVSGIEKYNHPYICSIQALSTSTPGGVWGKSMLKYIYPFWQRAISTLLLTGVVLYGSQMNEYDAKDQSDDFMVQWFADTAKKMNGFGIPRKMRITSPGRCFDRIKKYSKQMSIHGIVKAEQVPVLTIPARRVVLSGDGGFNGSGNPDAKGRRGLGINDVPALLKIMDNLGIDKYEYLDRGLYREDNDKANLSAFDPSVLRALAGIQPEKPARLAVRDGQFYYKNDGTVPIKLCGVSRWEALWREKHTYFDWGQYSLFWYEEELGRYGINYVRHGSYLQDFEFVYQHCKRMKDKGIIVELTVFRTIEEGRLLVLSESNIKRLHDLGNVFFDCHNEFMDDIERVNEAKHTAEIITGYGGIVSGGAWGASTDGKKNSELFHSVCSAHKVSTVHRQWTPEEITNALKYGKPVIRNEYFDRGDLGLSLVKQIMRETFEAGGQGCQYYGFAIAGLQGLIAPDLFDYKEMLTYAGQLTKELNQ